MQLGFYDSRFPIPNFRFPASKAQFLSPRLHCPTLPGLTAGAAGLPW